MKEIATMLGFAAKAGQLLLGTASVERGIKQRQVAMVICATDLSAKTIKNFKYWCDLNRIDFFSYGFRSELGHWVGAPERGIIGIVSKQFASRLRQLLEDRGDQQ